MNFRPGVFMPAAVPGPDGLLMESELELIKPHITQRPNPRTLRRTLTGVRTPLWCALCGAHSAADSHAAQTQWRTALWQAPSLLQTLKVGQDAGPTSSTAPACSGFRARTRARPAPSTPCPRPKKYSISKSNQPAVQCCRGGGRREEGALHPNEEWVGTCPG